MLISFIIPYFNAQSTILRTLNSIYASGLEYSSFEVILIDDFSAIPASTVLKSISYNNFRIIRHTTNKKQGAGRNTGIRYSNGDYIFFVDADDTITAGICSAFKTAEKYQPDIVACKYTKQDASDRTHLMGHKCSNDLIIPGSLFCEKYVDPSFSFCPCAYLFKKDYLTQSYSPFQESVFMEDSDWVARHLFYAKSIICSESIIYNYIYNSNSTIHSLQYTHLSGWIQTGIRKLLLSKEVAPLSESYARLLFQDAQWNINGAMKKIWYVKHIWPFYRSIKYEHWALIKTMRWPKTVSLFINHQFISCCLLYVFGPIIRLIKQIRSRRVSYISSVL